MRDSSTKRDIAIVVADKHGIQLSQAQLLLNSFIEAMGASLLRGKDLEFRGFGNLRIMHRKEKKARNIHKGEELMVPACTDVKFITAKSLKKRLNKKTKF